MTDIIIEKNNESYVQLHCNEEINHEINNLFSAFAAGYRFNPRYVNHLWDGRVRVYSPITQLLPIGLVSNLMKWCDSKKYTYKTDFFDDFTDEIDKDELRETINGYVKKFDVRDYQFKAVYEALTNKKGILLSCTGSGKSLMIYCIFRYLLEKKKLKRLLLIVPNTSLVEQMYTDFIDYGWDNIEESVELLYSGKKPTYRLPVLISTWQSLQTQDKSFFERYDCVLVDEAHGVKANVVSKIMKSCFNAEYKLGTTGTLPTELSEQLIINSVIGNVIFELKSKELIDLGHLTKLNIASIFLKYPDEFIAENKNRTYQEEVKMVEEYENRNSVLNMIIDHSKNTDNILVLVNHKNHLKEIKDYLIKQYPNKKVNILMGDIKSAERETIRKNIEYEEGTIVIGTYAVCSTGLNIPRLHAVILYANSKSRIKVLQSIGRGLRKHNSKNKVIIYDIIDDLSYKTRTGKTKKNYCMQHYDERLSYYTEQQFPVINLVKNI